MSFVGNNLLTNNKKNMDKSEVISKFEEARSNLKSAINSKKVSSKNDAERRYGSAYRQLVSLGIAAKLKKKYGV